MAVLLGLCQVRSLDYFRRDCWYWNHPDGSASFAYPCIVADVIQQAIKAYDVACYLTTSDQYSRYALKWLFVDFLCCVGLAQLRIPRLHYAKSIVFLQIMLLWLVDGFLFGGIVVDFGLGSAWDILPHVRFTGEYL